MNTTPNTVLGHTERVFRDAWISVLWKAMAKTGRGYHRPRTRNLPPVGASHWRGDRRTDKSGTTKLSRRLAQHMAPKLTTFPAM